ncbi:MAG: thiol oxidoreductase, partial [Phormidesmis sp. RL_2_1]|nr:thiol oxidoreductase [Phormidesmis sp. RL_2_1]
MAAIFFSLNVRDLPVVSHLPIFNAHDNYQAGGITTFYNRSSHAFSQPAPGLNAQEMSLHTQGDVTFDAVFVTAPAPVNTGLGP